MNFELDLLTDTHDFLALEPEWDELLQDSANNNLFFTWDWVTTWLHWFGDDYDLWVITARQTDNGRLSAVAPLMTHRKKQSGVLPYRELLFLGSNQTAPDHLDFIVRKGMETAVSSALATYIWNKRDQWDVLHLDSAVSTGMAVTELSRLAPPQWQQSEEIICPFTPLPATWEEFQAQLGRNTRYNLRRYDRKLGEIGDAKYSQLADPADLPAALASLRRMHIITREGDSVTEYWNERVISFQQDLSEKMLANNLLRFYRLQLDDADIAVVYAFLYNDKLYYYMTGYDQEWSRYGPGRQVIGHTIRSCIAEGATEIDFLRGEEGYKFAWLGQPRHTIELKIAASNKAKLLMQARRMKAKIRNNE